MRLAARRNRADLDLMYRLLLLPAVDAERYGRIKFELRVLNPPAALAAVSVRTGH